VGEYCTLLLAGPMAYFCSRLQNYCSALQVLQEAIEMAGIKEVAEEAGVSTATVSRALRGFHHVNAATRAKIMAAAEKLDYPISPIQSKNVSGRTNSIGVVAPYI